MSRTKQVLILAVILAGAVAGGVIAINPFGPSSVQANQGGRGSAQKWEHCAITNASFSGGGFNTRGVATIRYFQADGWKEEAVDFVPDLGYKRYEHRLYENGAMSKAIAKLGDEGWEMVSTNQDSNYNVSSIYFKRPKQ
jgi:hypothetical protein